MDKTNHFLRQLLRYSMHYIFPMFFIYSCSLADFHNEEFTSGKGQQIIYPETINENLLLPEAKQYFENISLLAQWYSKNPQFRVLPVLNSPSDIDNTLLRKLESIILIDSTGNQISIFDLDKNSLNEFLNSWKMSEALGLSQKIGKDTAGISKQLFINRNQLFAEAVGRLKSASLTEDPYFAVQNLMVKKEKEKITTPTELINLKSSEYTDDNFWATVISNGLMSFSVIHAVPNEISPQTFVDRLRPNLKKGRILIALPGGFTTTSLIIFYPNKTWFDVGHIAVVTKDSEEIADSIDDNYNFTIGTGVIPGTQPEEIGHAWCIKHGMAFLGKVCQIKWEIYKDASDKWKWRKVITDADNELILKEVEKNVGVPYSNVVEVFFSKWVAPKSFICSSLAWYCTLKETGIDISDWWDTSVYPVDLFFSENIQIIDDTLD
jgi:hypothetical protein